MNQTITFNHINFHIVKDTEKIDKDVQAYESLITIKGANQHNETVFHLTIKERFFDRLTHKETILTLYDLIQDDQAILTPLFNKVKNTIDPYHEKKQIMRNWVNHLEELLQLEKQPYHADVI